uniref:Uncharacterized protein n=1 Tax=Arundo donax TaxID=35708 RepID=A0A0A9BH33_ARUDO
MLAHPAAATCLKPKHRLATLQQPGRTPCALALLTFGLKTHTEGACTSCGGGSEPMEATVQGGASR